MPRMGQNPMKWLESNYRPKKITITTIVYIPVLEKYWAESLDVLKLSFESLIKNTKQEFDFMVFDNGSCKEVRDYLLRMHKDGFIQSLILSQHNLRHLGALDFLLSVAPGDIVSFANSDIYFLPGWLDATIKIFEAYPEAGQVSALPPIDIKWIYCDKTVTSAKKNPAISIKKGSNLIPKQFTEAYRLGFGLTPDELKKRIAGREDVLFTKDGVAAYVLAKDFQFTTTKKAIRAVLPLNLQEVNEYRDPVYTPLFEKWINEKGFWRLSTPDYLVHHIGNKMPRPGSGLDWIFPQCQNKESMLKFTHSTPPKKESYLKKRIFGNRYVRKGLKKINALSFRLLFED